MNIQELKTKILNEQYAYKGFKITINDITYIIDRLVPYLWYTNDPISLKIDCKDIKSGEFLIETQIILKIKSLDEYKNFVAQLT